MAVVFLKTMNVLRIKDEILPRIRGGKKRVILDINLNEHRDYPSLSLLTHVSVFLPSCTVHVRGLHLFFIRKKRSLPSICIRVKDFTSFQPTQFLYYTFNITLNEMFLFTSSVWDRLFSCCSSYTTKVYGCRMCKTYRE